MIRTLTGFLCVFELLFLVSIPALAQEWTFVANGQGTPRSIAADSSGMTIIAAYSGAGYWITEDGGTTWTPYNASMSASPLEYTNNVQISDAEAQIRLVDGHFQSQHNYDMHTFDGGETWTTFEFDPYWPDEVPGPGSGVWALPGHAPGKVYFACQMGFAYNDNWGTWWSVLNISHLVGQVEGIFVHPDDADVVFVYGYWDDEDWPTNGPAGGIVGSFDGGETFTRLTEMEMMCEAETGSVDDITMLSNGDLIACTMWTGMSDPYPHFLRSQDGGQSWWWYPYYGLPEMMHTNDIEAVHEVEGRIFVTSRYHGGVYRSDDYGVNWERVYDGLPIDPSGVYSFYRNPFSGHLYLGMKGQGIYSSTDYGETFEPVPGPPLSIGSLVIPDEDGLWQGTQGGRVFFAEDGYSNFVEYTVDYQPDYDTWLHPFPLPTGTIGLVELKRDLYDLSTTSRIHTIDLASGTWTNHPEHDLNMSQVLSYQAGDQTMLAGYSGSFSTIYLSDDLGDTWETIEHDEMLLGLTRHRDRWYALDANARDVVYAWNLYGPWEGTGFPVPDDLYGFENLVGLDDTLYVCTIDACWALLPDDTWQGRGIYDGCMMAWDLVTTPEDTIMVAAYWTGFQELNVSYDLGWSWQEQDLEFPWPNQTVQVESVTWDDQRQRLWLDTGAGLAYLDFAENSVHDPWVLQPANFDLLTAYPNPFNASTTIRFTLEAPQQVKLKVFDVLGRHVATLADGIHSAGRHEVTFDGSEFPTGSYFLQYASNVTTFERKLVLLK